MSGYAVHRKSRPAFQQILHEFTVREKLSRRHTLEEVSHQWYQHACLQCTKLYRLMMSKARIQRLPEAVDIVRHGENICKDYITYKLRKQGLFSLKVEAIIVMTPRRNSDGATVETMLLASELERLYPDLYQNISKQLQMTMSSDDIVRNIIQTTADVLLENEASITWARVIALLCMCAAVATDCVRQGQAKLLKVVIETFRGILQTRLVTWIRVRGGWTRIVQFCHRPKRGKSRRLWLATSLVLASSSLATMLYVY